MSDFLNEYLLAIATATPLPSVEGRAALSPLFPVAKKDQNKKRKPKITIFVDADAGAYLPRPSSKRSKTSTPRTPLSGRTSTNSTPSPSPSPLRPDTPFTFSPMDPDWEDIENYNTQPFFTPPGTPLDPFIIPYTPAAPLSPSSAQVRPRHSGQVMAPANLLPPVNMIVYNMLGLDSWNVSADTIGLAYYSVSLNSHPDKVSDKEKELASLEMKQINVAKELLLDADNRRKYHQDGVVPWVV
ncbi:hypothetical protein BDW02DRAFT_602575 [Decorospora gaudefroyi]|uniref:J domain-containing protein n=1 Tax=Decorospora gaudefroyi TaxID=184978 RepID=A0A6A5JX82_9PLEO|nr:hypothetical protein BDW02DRAFT_602575 [Decorospora gaudefroyi]